MEISKLGIIMISAFTIFAALAVAWFIFISASKEYIYPDGNSPEHNSAQANENPAGLDHMQTDAFMLLRSIGVGWNLGNTLDSLDRQSRSITGELQDNVTPEEFYETLWGNPVTTFEMIESIAEMGFGAVRVPVTWKDNMDENFNIRADWLKRVEQIVNYVLDNNMYCIINVHHDNGSGTWPWLRADPDNIEWMEEHFAIVWTQIAEHFADYSDRLIFEGFNEILDAHSNWTNAGRAAYMAVNRLNQVFVDTVRAAGGNNPGRFLVVKTYGARVYDDVLRNFVLPSDSAEHRLIVGVHYYGTHGFVRQQEDAPWTTTYSDWDYLRHGRMAEEVMTRLRINFVDNGIPVIITEFGATNKNNTNDRINYAVHYIETARRYGITALWWDDGGRAETAEEVRNYALFDRRNNRWFFPEIAEAMVNAARS